MHKVSCTWAVRTDSTVGGHWGAEGQACPNHGIPTLHHLAAMHLGKNTIAFDQGWSCCFLSYDPRRMDFFRSDWKQLEGEAGQGWNKRVWFWDTRSKASNFGVLLTNLYPNCNIGVLIGVQSHAEKNFDCALWHNLAPGTPIQDSRVLCPESCRFARAVNDLTTTERLWGDCSESGQCFNRCKGTVIWRCVTCMFSQALRNTTYCNSTSLQLASLASSFTPFFNLFIENQMQGENSAFFALCNILLRRSSVTYRRQLQTMTCSSPVLFRTVLRVFFFRGLQNGEIFHELSFASFPASANFGENYLGHDLKFILTRMK